MSDITMEGVRVRREGRLVLDVPSLTLRARRTTAILGPNGSGKTTLLRVIAGLERAAEGIVRGVVAFGRANDVAYVFQEAVFLRQSVRENLALALRLRHVPKTDVVRRIEEAATLLHVTHLLERRADHLSGGEARRVSLARALCLRAPLVLLDEPLTGLDEPAYIQFIDDLPKVLSAFDTTTVLVTHRRDEALRLAQDLAVLVDGRVRMSGEIREVTTNPQTIDVATALGYTVVSDGPRRVALAPGALKLGAGALEFVMTVDQVVHTVDGTQVVGRINDTRVRARAVAGGDVPECGVQVVVSADRLTEVS